MPDASGQPSDVVRAYTALNDLAGRPPSLRTETDGTICLELAVTPALTTRWDDLLAVLDLGSTYGLADTDDGQVVWTRFEAPGTI